MSGQERNFDVWLRGANADIIESLEQAVEASEFEAWRTEANDSLTESLEQVIDTEAVLLMIKQQAASEAVAVAHANGNNEPERAIRSVLAPETTHDIEEARRQPSRRAPAPQYDVDLTGQPCPVQSETDSPAANDIAVVPSFRAGSRSTWHRRIPAVAASAMTAISVAVVAVLVVLALAGGDQVGAFGRAVTVAAVVMVIGSLAARTWASVVEWKLRPTLVRLARDEHSRRLVVTARGPWAVQFKTYHWLHRRSIAPRPITNLLLMWEPGRPRMNVGAVLDQVCAEHARSAGTDGSSGSAEREPPQPDDRVLPDHDQDDGPLLARAGGQATKVDSSIRKKRQDTSFRARGKRTQAKRRRP